MRCVPIRQTLGSATSAARRVWTSPSFAAIARAKIAGSFLGARPVSDTTTMRWTIRWPSSLIQRRVASALSEVSFRSDA
jgi:hypothetical protein